jgi:elongation factor Ts
MSTISAQDVKALRDQTGAGMMDCKKALSEANGDMEKAIEYLRKQGQKLSDKRADREAKEGVVLAIVSDGKTKGVIVRLSCETDFVSKNESFVALTQEIADLALAAFPADKEALLAVKMGNITIAEKAIEQTGVIGEKIEVASYERLEAPMVAPYIHMGNKAGVLVALTVASDDVYEAGREVAMQVAAMKPVAVDEHGVDASIVEKEIEIGKEIARQEGKPEAMLEKIAMGKLNRFYKDNTLLNQLFVKDSKVTVGEYLTSKNKDLTVTAFKHVTLG